MSKQLGNTVAAYAFLTVEGLAEAIKRYLDDGVPRVLVPMRLVAQHVADKGANPNASIVWQKIRVVGNPSPT